MYLMMRIHCPWQTYILSFFQRLRGSGEIPQRTVVLNHQHFGGGTMDQRQTGFADIHLFTQFIVQQRVFIPRPGISHVVIPQPLPPDQHGVRELTAHAGNGLGDIFLTIRRHMSMDISFADYHFSMPADGFPCLDGVN